MPKIIGKSPAAAHKFKGRALDSVVHLPVLQVYISELVRRVRIVNPQVQANGSFALASISNNKLQARSGVAPEDRRLQPRYQPEWDLHITAPIGR